MTIGRGRLFMAAALAAVAARVPAEPAKPWAPPLSMAIEPPETTGGGGIRAGAGKPWKRGGRHTIKQRRALAFAAGRR